MIRVYSTPDARARCIKFRDEDPDARPPLQLVQAFPDGEEAAAWALLHELGEPAEPVGEPGRPGAG